MTTRARNPDRSLRIPTKGIEENVVSSEVASILSKLSVRERMKLVDGAFHSARRLVERAVRVQRPDLQGRAYEDEVIRRLTGGDIAVMRARQHCA
ncbi:MAG TPA: hypothetical protein VHN77_06205 [Phycisphaerales bacterium]|nr:hypothetical protein [Phycisphaerales bacterium]